MPFVVLSDLNPGLRESEVSVAVRDARGRLQRLRVERDFLKEASGRHYLPMGIVGRHPESKLVLIELPIEADSGANRLWVTPEDILEEAVAK
jgi:hypothetical protein